MHTFRYVVLMWVLYVVAFLIKYLHLSGIWQGLWWKMDTKKTCVTNTGFVKSAIQYVKVHINELLQMQRFQ